MDPLIVLMNADAKNACRKFQTDITKAWSTRGKGDFSLRTFLVCQSLLCDAVSFIALVGLVCKFSHLFLLFQLVINSSC